MYLFINDESSVLVTSCGAVPDVELRRGRAGGWENCLLGVLVGVTQSLALLERLLGCGYTLGGEAKQKGMT